ncbi:iron ABC transporter permease [Paenibacillus sp. YPG26]|uniref:FecCD family ABC transporter permease n=1 Tax=Paenibacillus sp. YPG26 TaxID=2878915 RepID=UPI002041AB34|nr:iron ABC transporter permease [Paenibacillus sp. YPG26]USB34971.1 iron ABC transporter permease [Paenibacillus sp. YPG26]
MIRSARGKLMILAVLILLLSLGMIASLMLGYHRFGMKALVGAVFQFNGSEDHLLIRTVRIPAVLISAAVGAGLAVAGAVMQVLTRNPLASPSLLGINAGAVLLIVIFLSFASGDPGMGELVWIAFTGAAMTTVFVYVLGRAGPGGFQPIKLTLAGAAFAALASAATSAVMLLNNESLGETLFWLIGSVTGRKLEHLTAVAPYMLAGLLIALAMSRSLNVMALDEDVAAGLGQWGGPAKAAAVLSVVLLAGGAVAVAGPIGFVGLIVPHICRYLIGSNHYWLLPYCAVAGALLLVSADLASRYVLMPKEVPVGLLTAMLGVPFFIYLARRGAA